LRQKEKRLRNSYLEQWTDLGDAVATDDGSFTLMEPALGELYHSESGAQTETQALYMAASGFDVRVREVTKPLTVLDVGLGLGYNALQTISSWYQRGSSDLNVLSLEWNENLVRALTSDCVPWGKAWENDRHLFREKLRPSYPLLWNARIPKKKHSCSWTVCIGDASTAPISQLISAVDYIWQDPFSPRHDTSLWDVDWFRKLRAVSHEGTVLVTYSCSGFVRRSLDEAGWKWEKIPARGKREWLRATPKTT
jgi:tRNA U34 5-methylaminomethyl-2-thiouridine-forming methyltransferase MnmC